MGWGLRLRTLLTGVMILLACQVGEVLAAAQIKSVRIWRAPDNTRLVFDLSGPVQHSLFTLAAPNRIVIDVSGAQLATQLNGLKLGNTPITAVRSAQRTPNDLRMVLDLSAQVTPKSFVLPPNQQYGNRLVVDLYDQGADLTPDVPATPTPSVPVTPVTPT
ncbi:N-acetylmuramoyl-L-alanine amidase AmiB, partial [Pseudomonas aeruginosa]